MKKTFLILIIILTGSIFSYPFVVPYFDEEFFLYPFLNYDQSVEWKKAREGKLYDGSLIQTSHGSLTTWMLMSNEEAVVNRDIGDDFTFRLRYRKYVNRHLSYDENSVSTGFGYKINENFTLYTETILSDLKSDIDIKPGVFFKFQTVYAYLGLNFNDFLFDIKNVGGGLDNSTPVTLSSDIRFSFSRLYFFISGNYGTGIDRTWTANAYTDILSHKNHIRNIYARVEYDLTDYLKIYSENYFDDFYDEKRLKDVDVWDPTLNRWVSYEPEISEYKFTAKLSDYKLGAIWSLNKNNILDLGLSLANTTHNFEIIDGLALENGHAINYKIKYTALLPSFMYNYKFNDKFKIETGFMGSYTQGDDESLSLIKYNEHFWDKELIKLGAEYRFNPNCSLYVSAGQLINTGVFGGGNARFNLFF